MNRVRCDQCGAVSRLAHLYVKEAGLKRIDELHCPECHAPTTGEWKPLPGWPAALIVLALLGYTVFSDRAAWPLLLIVLFPALTILHELLHAIPAWLLGARVLEIHVGGGKRPSWRVGDLRIAITNWLVGGGFCAYAFRRVPVALWKHFVVTGLPLFFHLMSTLLLLRTGWPREGDATVLQMFALINGFIFLENIYPSGWSDGHHLLQLIRKGSKWADARGYLSLTGPAFHELEDGRKEAAIREAKAAEPWMPDPALGRALFTVYLQAGALDDAERFVEHAGHEVDPIKPKDEKEMLAHGYLVGEPARWLALVTLRVHQERFDDALAELDRWSASEEREEVRTIVRGQKALALLELGRVDEAEQEGREAFLCMPWLPLVKTVYGAVLVARGAVGGGVQQLEDVHDPVADAWRAIGNAGLNRPEAAREALDRARKEFGAPPSLLRRAEQATKKNP